MTNKQLSKYNSKISLSKLNSNTSFLKLDEPKGKIFIIPHHIPKKCYRTTFLDIDTRLQCTEEKTNKLAEELYSLSFLFKLREPLFLAHIKIHQSVKYNPVLAKFRKIFVGVLAV